MSDGNAPEAVTGFWSGRVEGTNRGTTLVRISGKSERLRATAILYDQQLGVTVVRLAGDLNGDRATLHVIRVRGIAGLVPEQGQVTLTFKEGGTADGNWTSDVGTQGSVTIARVPLRKIDWYARILRAKGAFVRYRSLAPLYAILLVALAILSAVTRVTLSWPAVVLLIVPMPFICRSQVAELIALVHTARIRRLGFVEFDQNPPTAQIIAVATQQAHQALAFMQLNQFFVLRTKILLAILAHANGLALADFRNLARQFGVAEENIDVTLGALRQANCAEMQADRVVPTAWGQTFVRFGLRLA